MPVERDKVFQAAQKLVEKKRYDKAIAEYQKIVAENPKDVRTLLKIGDLHLKLEQYGEAITTYEQVGQFYSQQGAAHKAIAVYKQIREIINKHAAHMADRFGHIVPQLAELYAQAGHTSDAVVAYDEVATRLQRAGRDRDAIEIFEKLIELDSANPLPQLRLAEAFVRLKDTDNAIMRFGAAANILVKGGRLGDALKVVERLLQHRPDVTFARMAAEIYLERNEANDAMAALTKLQLAFKEDPKDLDTLGLLARAFDQLDQPGKALEVMKEAARVAKEAGKAETYNAICDALLERAPDDAQVNQLAAQRMVVAPAPPPMEPEVAEADDVDIAAIEAAEESEEVVIDEEPASVVPEPEPPIEPDIIDEVDAENILEQSMSETYSPESMAPDSAVPIDLVPAVPRYAPLDPVVRAKQLLAQAEALRQRRDYQQAVTFLQNAIEELPDARDLREKLYDVLIEAGDRQGAIEEMLLFARYLAHRGDNDGAALILDELLLLEPGQPDATEMLAQLGYALTYESGPEYTDEYGNPYPAQGSGDPSQYVDPYYGSGSYNFDESSGAYARPEMPQGRAYGDRRLGPLTSDAPLPSYGIEEESAQFMDAPPSTRGMPLVPPTATLPHNMTVPLAPAVPAQAIPDPTPGAPPASTSPYAPSRPGVASAHRRRPTPPPRSSYAFSQLDEDALEEIEFFARHGMFDQARAMLDVQLERLPNHPLILEKKREIEELAARALSDRESGTRALPRAAEPRPSEAAYDISASLDALDQLEMGGNLEATAPLPAAQQQVDVESMFEQFKAGVSEGAPGAPAHISESDAATHYDLGVAYKEMGLFTDAIAEFELASRDPGRECVCLSMIGMIYIQVGEIDAAIDAFMRGLQVRNKTREQEYALTYEVANAYEMQGLPEQALMFFQRLAAMNPGYSDPRGSVSDRMIALDPNQRTATRNVGGGGYGTTDNLDDAFDEMMGGRKKK